MINALIQTSYPQALAKLIVILRDIHLAEDYLQSAVEQALLKWPQLPPENTVAWLVKVARNKYIDEYRKQLKQESFDSICEVAILPDLCEEALLLSYNDDLLRLIFTSCHPALNQETQILLALKHILGLTLVQIANGLVISTKTLEKRLTRAKTKISVNNIKYETPKPEEWPERLISVQKTIYLLFNEGYLTTEASGLIDKNLCKEAVRLARLLHQCIKNDAEVIGLLALLLQQEARIPARIDHNGQMILLADQDRSLWKKTNIQEGNILVEKALREGKGTPYAIQAAIASLHNNAVNESSTDWPQIYQLYQLLGRVDNNPIIELNAAVALAESGDCLTAIQKVIGLRKLLEKYRHYYTALAGLYFKDGQYKNSLAYYQLASERTNNQNERVFISKRIYECQNITK